MHVKINFRQLKYVVPLIFLPGLLIIGYVAFPLNKNEIRKKSKLKSEEQLIMEIQEAEQKVEKSKFENLRTGFKNIFDTTSVTPTIETDTLENLLDAYDNIQRQQTQEETQTQGPKTTPYYTDWQQFEEETDEDNVIPLNTNPITKGREIELFKQQLRTLDSLKHPEVYNNNFNNEHTNYTQATEDSDDDIVKKEEPMEKPTIQKIEKETEWQNSVFNTINAKKDNVPVKAILDELIKVADGSRIKIRLLDNVVIGDNKLTKGTYLYGKVTGFGDERVKITISSVLINGRIVKVNIDVYDNDGQEGFYVPKSAFRDATKQAGGQISSQSVNLNNNHTDNTTARGMATQFGLQALQNLYNTSSQTLAKAIRKNRAILKYASFVYLINKDEEQ